MSILSIYLCACGFCFIPDFLHSALRLLTPAAHWTLDRLRWYVWSLCLDEYSVQSSVYAVFISSVSSIDAMSQQQWRQLLPRSLNPNDVNDHIHLIKYLQKLILSSWTNMVSFYSNLFIPLHRIRVVSLYCIVSRIRQSSQSSLNTW